jgi:hypothetical protein
MDSVLSVAGVPIRLTAERWFHIVENHDDLAGHYDEVLETVGDPEVVVRGYGGSLIAVRTYGRRHYLSVVYREVSSNDGFIITAYFGAKIRREEVLWKRP